MFKNFFKTAWRNLLRNRTSSFINISGLSVGMAVAMLIACWIYQEWSFDRQFGNYKTIAQVWQRWSGGHGAQWQMPAAVADELRGNFSSNFKHIVLSSRTQDNILSFGDKKLIRSGNFIEPDGLKLFTVPMRYGNLTALNDPHSIILSASLSKAFFGDRDPVGQVLHLNDSIALKVTGVYEDFPYTSSLAEVQFLSPWALYESFDPETTYNRHSWGDNNWQTFVQISDNTSFEQISAKIEKIKAIHDPWPDSAGRNQNTTQVFLHPMSRWHFYSAFQDGDPDTGRIQYIRLFGIIGAFVLLLACINFMNLSTARSEKRAKEVGVRKTIGSLRTQLIGQFFVESIVVSFIALIIAVILVWISLPFFNRLAETQTTIPWSKPFWWIACVGFSLFTGFIAGSYPALYLSSFQPIKVLKGVFRMGRLAALPRQVLVVLQFTISIAMIIGTIVVFRQVQYARERPVGYNRSGLLMVEMHTLDIYNHFSAFRADLLNTGAVKEVTESVSPITASWPQNGGLIWPGHGRTDPIDVDFTMKGITREYAKTIGLQVVEGRDFRTDVSGADARTMILSESTVKHMGLKDPVGKTIAWQNTQFTVIGVVKNMVMESPYESPVPAIYYLAPFRMSSLTVRLNPNLSGQEAIRRISPIFARYSPADPFDYKFVDQEYDAKFRAELRIGRLAGFFTILAIFISCLGLFGLASFVAEQRTREIGVRKVLGARLFNLWRLLSREFVLLTALSCLIAIPIACSVLQGWLQHFVYRTAITWWILASAVMGTLIITLLTVSFQAVKTAMANPVRSLRSE